MNPDELMRLPPTEALILNQGMPAYIAKKCVYYEDLRFKDKAYSVRTLHGKTVITGFKPPATRAELEKEIAGLPSWIAKQQAVRAGTAGTVEPITTTEPVRQTANQFDPLNFIGCYESPDQIIPESCKTFTDAAVQENFPDASVQENFVDAAVQENSPISIPEALALDPRYFSGD
jgi:hypothetical protein